MKICGRFLRFVLLMAVSYAVVYRLLWPLTFNAIGLSADGKNKTSYVFPPTNRPKNKPEQPDEDELNGFIYLVQTSKCLPKHFLNEEYFGNKTLCECSVIVLSFRERCQYSPLPPHIQYEYIKNISWTRGRNFLVQRAKEQNNNYQYYVLLDDDIRLSFNDFTPKYMKNTSPLRAFETFLKQHEPAIGVTDYDVHHGAKIIVSKRKKLCKNSGAEKPLYLPTVHFDASFNAFHYKTLDYLLPYITTYDNQCWWHAQRYLIAKAEIIFRGQSVLFAPVHTSNPVHSEYPKDDRNSQQIWSFFVDTITEEVPRQYRNESFLREFKKDPKHYTENSLTVCLDLPAHTRIEPFQHFYWRFG